MAKGESRYLPEALPRGGPSPGQWPPHAAKADAAKAHAHRPSPVPHRVEVRAQT